MDHRLTRGEGRNRSEIKDLDRRIQALDEDLLRFLPELKRLFKDSQKASDQDETRALTRSFFFTVEAYAWAVLQRLRAELFERRLDLPKTDMEIFSILQRNGFLDLVEGRRLRQFCESRHLSSRDLSKIDFDGVLTAVEEGLSETRSILKRFETPTTTL